DRDVAAGTAGAAARFCLRLRPAEPRALLLRRPDVGSRAAFAARLPAACVALAGLRCEGAQRHIDCAPWAAMARSVFPGCIQGRTLPPRRYAIHAHTRAAQRLSLVLRRAPRQRSRLL